MVKKEYIVKVESRLKSVSPELEDGGYGGKYHPPAVKVINSVMSQALRYRTRVYPKLADFKKNHPDVKSIRQLAYLMASYTKPVEFLKTEMGLGHRGKAGAIEGLVKYFCGLIEASPTVPEEETLKQWAITTELDDYKKLNIKGVGPATVQYLRMLFGADTSKPDAYHEFHKRNHRRGIIRIRVRPSYKRCCLIFRGVRTRC